VLLLPRDHPLAAARALAPKDLDGQPWIAVSQGRERFVASCAGAGFVPNVAYGAPDTATVLGMVEAGAGLAILPRCVSGAASANVVVRELGWLPFVTRLHAVCPAQGASAAATQLMALLAKRAPGAAAKPRQGRRARST
jgi:DNA-binding transcriptional LysR family regulator